MDNYAWSYDEENFNLDSKIEAIEALYESHWNLADKPSPEQLISMMLYYGVPAKPKASNFISVDRFLENMGENAYDEHEEFAEDFPQCSSESVKELENLLADWANRNCPVNFWTVGDVKKYIITQGDIDECFSGVEGRYE